jgi:Na+-transporting NADH:ubiquinone oxidoreductase subunit NqrB
MEVSALFPMLAFAVPYLAARQMISSAVMRLSDQERLTLFPVGRARQLLTWLLLPLIVALYLASTLPAIAVALAAAVIFIVGLELFQLVRVRKLALSPEFKRTHLIATAIACSGVLLAAAILGFQALTGRGDR